MIHYSSQRMATIQWFSVYVLLYCVQFIIIYNLRKNTYLSFREFHYNYYLSPHRNILNAYDVAFRAGDFYMFAQELAPFGDLTSNTSDTGIGEINTKKIACQLASALDFMHSAVSEETL